MTTNSPNTVDGDVQTLIADCQAEIAMLKKQIPRWQNNNYTLPYLKSQLARQQVALAALTAEPVADVVTWFHPQEERRCAVQLRKFDLIPGHLYTTPPAQLLGQVELPDIKTARSNWSAWEWIEHLGGRFQNGQPGDYIEFGSVYAVAQMLKQYRRTVTAEVIAEIAESLRQQGIEVKS